MTDLAPGCKVICINDTDDTDFHGSCIKATPVKDHKYTIVAFWTVPQAVDDELEMCECVVLQEISNPNCMCLRFGLLPLGFFAWRFAIETKQEVSSESQTMQQLRKVAADVSKPKQLVSARKPKQLVSARKPKQLVSKKKIREDV